MYNKSLLTCLILIEIIFNSTPRISAQDEPEIPGQMPSPPKPPPRQGGGGLGVGAGLRPGSTLPNPPPQNTPNGAPPVAATVPEPPPPPVPFGLKHIILILVPQFKVSIPNLPKWMGANAKVSLPITVFFDKLKVPQPPPPGPIPPPYYGPFFPGGHFVKKRSVEEFVVPVSSHSSSTTATRTNIPPAKEKEENHELNETIYRGERVTLIPKLEKLLGTFGIEGKPCLLRAICEVHQIPLHQHGYGLLGELFTLFFSISRSGFANTHLSEYMKAEEAGKHYDCSTYVNECQTSLFYWEKVGNVTDTSDLEDHFDDIDELNLFLELLSL